MGAANRATVLLSVPISYRFHSCTVLLVLHFVVVKWCCIKYKALPFYLLHDSELIDTHWLTH